MCDCEYSLPKLLFESFFDFYPDSLVELTLLLQKTFCIRHCIIKYTGWSIRSGAYITNGWEHWHCWWSDLQPRRSLGHPQFHTSTMEISHATRVIFCWSVQCITKLSILKYFIKCKRAVPLLVLLCIVYYNR